MITMYDFFFIFYNFQCIKKKKKKKKFSKVHIRCLMKCHSHINV